MTLVSDQIREQGYCFVSPFTEQETDDIRAYLTSRQIYPGCHVVKGAGPPGPWEMHASADVVSWHMHDVLLAPHLIEKFLRHTADAGDFLGTEDPILYSVNAFCTRPVAHVRPDIQDWHRDTDDAKFVPLFTYLTDVGEDEAQHLRGPQGEVTISGTAGTTFFSNTMCEHYGGKPKTGERMIVWCRWGVSDPPASYVWDSLQPMDKTLLGDAYPTDPWLQRSMRLVAR
jgi:hypothetical protein